MYLMMTNALSIQQATTSGGNAVTTQPMDMFNKVHSHFHHSHNKPMPTRITRLYLHLMTKLNYFDGTTTWGILPFPCWNLWLRTVKYQGD
jgi:hypothetical protein